MCEHSGSVITKEQLITSIWVDVCVTDDSLVQCIVEIRRALGPENGKYLRTVTRHGYTLHAESLKSNSIGAENPSRRVIVGPFRASAADEQAVFAQSLSDTITIHLLQNTECSLQVASAEHPNGADYQLQGSVLVHENRTRVMVQLLDLSSKQYIWAQSYEQSQEDTFALQDYLSRTISDDLIGRLGGGA